jgi:acetoacetyl-CoA reductase
VLCDLTDPEACRAAVSEVESTLGKVDILINNQDFCRPMPFHGMAAEDWYDVVNVNLHSLYNICRPIIPGMRDRRFGRVVNITSVIGQAGSENLTSYAAAKAAVIGFTRALALENAKYGITVNAVAPGWIATGARPGGAIPAVQEPPVGRLGSPDEVASCVTFLAEESSGFITGETLSINGGGYLS